VVSHKNVAFELHMLAKRANGLRRAAWAEANGITAEELAANDAKVKKAGKPAVRGKQKGEVPPGAETAELEGWKPFAWKHNALRHSFISYRVAQVQDVAKVSLEAGNSPRMVFSNYRELVRTADAEKWFAVTPEALYERAIGYTAPDCHVSQYKGIVTVTPFEKHFPPDTTACIFWLKNRKPAEWRDRSEVALEKQQEIAGVPPEMLEVLRKRFMESVGPDRNSNGSH